MKNTKFANTLKKYRKMNHMSVGDVADYLHRQKVDIAIKTIYGWESGQTQPSADNLMHLCSLYQIQNILDAFGYRTVSDDLMTLSAKERQLILSYRQHDSMQEAVDKLLDIDTEAIKTAMIENHDE